MKLILCIKCEDVVRLIPHKKRECSCGLCWGYYTDGLNATISGDSIPIGFDNHSFVKALRNRPAYGWGEKFEAFVIPRECDTITVEE